MMTPGPVDYNRIEIKHMKRGQLFDHTNIPMVGCHNSSERGQPTSLQTDLVPQKSKPKLLVLICLEMKVKLM